MKYNPPLTSNLGTSHIESEPKKCAKTEVEMCDGPKEKADKGKLSKIKELTK